MKGNLEEYNHNHNHKTLSHLRIHLILLIYCCLNVQLTTSNYYYHQMRKCCLSGQLLSNRLRIDCITEYNSNIELYSYSDMKNIQNYVIPKCDNFNETTVIYLDGIKSDDLNKSHACLDIVQRETIPKELPILVYCHLNKNNTNKIANELSSLITTIRRCCPKYMIYDPNNKSCVPFNYSVYEFQLSLINNNNNNNNSSFNNDNMIDYFEDTFMSLLPIVKPKDFLLAVTRGPPICKNVIFDLNITSNDLIYEDGLFKVKPMSLNQNGFTKDQIELTKNNTCYEVTPETTISNGKLILRACYNERICSDKLCIRKCCPEDEFFIAGQFGCNKLNNETYVKHGKFHETLLNVSKHRNSFTNGYGILVGVPCGKQGKYILGPNDTYSLTSKGYLDHVQARIYNHHEYCMEMYRNYPDEGFYPFVCFEENEKQCELRCNIYTILQLISCGFFFMTLIVYACLPVLQNLHGKTLMCHVAHIFCAYFSLAIINLVTPERNADKSTATILCKFLGYTMLFSFLSAFSWLNVMCFDIWWTFGGTRGSTSTRRRGHRKRFLLYCLYAWGLACLMTVIVIVVDHTHILPNYLTPGIGLGSCWFNHGKYVYAEIVFFIGPVTLQLIINILFFVVTSINCNKVKAEIDRVIADPSDVRNKRYQADRIRLMMNIKLFIVMGISWILEIISYFMNKYAQDWKWREDFFYFSDLYNCLQGLAIFVLFVLKKRVYYALRKRLGFEDRRTSSNATTALHDTSRVNKSASNSTLMSTFQVSSTP